MESRVLESRVEVRLVREVKKIGGTAYKFQSMGNNGVPDRLVIAPGGRIYFIELKNPNGKVRKLQKVKMNELRELGANVRVISNYEEIDEFIEELNGEE